MEPIPIKLPPGFFRNGTEYESAGRWFDGNLVRWENKRIKPWGGWRRVLAGGATLTGLARAGIAWRDNTNFKHIAIGTNAKLYVGTGGNYSDQTPAGLTVGRPDTIEGPGYGAGPYGAEKYGTKRAINAIVLDAGMWAFDTFGEDLLACPTWDGRIFRWQPSIGGLATVLPNAPTGNIGVIVTDQQHVIALGAGGNRRKIQWPNQADPTNWTVGPTSTAGSRILKTSGTIVSARLHGTQPLIWTSTDVHVLDYIGPPLIHDPRRIAETGGLIGMNAVTGNTEELNWMGLGSFYRYNGGVVSTLPCEVQSYVFDDFNVQQRSKVFAAHNSRYKEFTWFYPSANSVELNRYVTRNYGEDIWYFGQLARTVWVDRGVFTLPIAVDDSGVVWEHDVGFLGDGLPRAGIFVESGPAEIGDGKNVIYANMLLPDVTNPSAVQLKIKTKTAPQGTLQEYGPYAFTSNTEGYVPVRFSGRQVAQRIEQIQDADWSFGKNRIVSGMGGRR